MGESSRQVSTRSPGASERTSAANASRDHGGRTTQDDLVRPGGEREEAAERLVGHEDARAVRGLAHDLQNATHDEEVVGHASVGRLADEHELVPRLHFQRARKLMAHDHLARSGRVEPGSVLDPLVDTAHGAVPRHVDPVEVHAGRGLPGRPQPKAQQARGRRVSPLVEAPQELVRVGDARVERGIVLVVGRVDLYVAQLEVEDVALHGAQVTLHQARVDDHDRERERRGGDGHQGPASVAPDVSPGHPQDAQDIAPPRDHHPPRPP